MITTCYPHIAKSDGQPAHLDMHPRTRVSMIVLDYLAYGWSPDEIRRQHPHLTMAEVHAAMGYYYDHQQEIEDEINAELDAASRAEETPRSTAWLKLTAKRSRD